METDQSGTRIEPNTVYKSCKAEVIHLELTQELFGLHSLETVLWTCDLLHPAYSLLIVEWFPENVQRT